MLLAATEFSFFPNVAPRVQIQPGFVWDEQDAYLFDIDGTLLRSRDRVHVDSFVACVQRLTGFEVTLAGIVLQGSTHNKKTTTEPNSAATNRTTKTPKKPVFSA